MKSEINKLIIASTGSIGIVAIPQFILMLRSISRNVHCILSKSAQNFIQPEVLKLYSNNEVLTDIFNSSHVYLVPHIEVCKNADIFLVMPATANIISKVAHGICDDIVSLSILSSTCPVIFVPSMNDVMWKKKIIQENIIKLKSLGYHIINPAKGIEISDFSISNSSMPNFEEVIKEIYRIYILNLFSF